MADTKATGLTEHVGPPADDDMLYMADVSDTTMAASGTSKKNQGKNYLRTNGTANTLGANISANGYNFTGAGKIHAGSVGIGVTPSYPLHVQSNSGVQLAINVPSGQRYTQLSLYNNNVEKMSFGFDDTNSYGYIGGNGVFTYYKGGSVGIGTDSPSYMFDVVHPSAGSQNIIRFGQGGVSNGYTVTSNGTRLTYTFDPSVTISGGTVTCVDVVETSSIEYKENLVEIAGVLNNLNNIKTYYYNRKGENKRSLGLVAEQVEAIFPEVVAVVDTTEVNENGESVIVQVKGLNYGRLTAICVLGLKELVERLRDARETLTTTLQALNQKTNGIDNRLKVIEAKVAALERALP